ncbi:MAG: hypothetical protein ABF479_10550 [Gluconacetobacter sp.]
MNPAHYVSALCTLGTSLLLAGCGSSTPAPEPVLLSQFNPATDRFQVISTVGKAEGTVQKDGRACDIYKIYTTGLTSGGRAAMTAGEVVTGIATLGLAEAVWAPVKAGTRPQLHTVLFCFGENEKLVDIYDKDPTDTSAARHLIVNRVAYAAAHAAPTSPVIVGAAPTIAPDATGAPTPEQAAGATKNDISPPASAEPSAEATASDVPVIYEKPVAPKSAAEAGTISLDNVSREATTGRAQVDTGSATAPSAASTDDLNALSAQKSTIANKAAFSMPAPPSSAAQDSAGKAS